MLSAGITQYACYNGSAITYFPGQSYGSQTCCLWGMQSQKNYHGWISQPWQTYAHGDFVFYGPLGSQIVTSWVEIDFQGDGNYWGNAG